MSTRSNDFSRRDAFRILGAAGAGVMLSGRFASAQTPATLPSALPQGAGFYRTHVGEWEITVINDGSFPFVPYPTIGSNASKEAVEQVLADNFIDPAKMTGQVNTLLVRRGSEAPIVVDTGCGRAFGPGAGFSKQNLLAAGVKAEDVACVFFTHLHPDHAGGAVGDDGKMAFPSASHVVHQAEVDFWTADKPDFSKSGVPAAAQAGMIATARKAIDAAGTSLRKFQGDAPMDIVPGGMKAIHTGGHTPGHCIVRFDLAGESMVYITDLAVQAALVFAHPEWFVGFDTDMQATIKIRQDLFATLAADRTLICGSHLPFPSIGHLKKSGNGYAFVPAPWKWA